MRENCKFPFSALQVRILFCSMELKLTYLEKNDNSFLSIPSASLQEPIIEYMSNLVNYNLHCCLCYVSSHVGLINNRKSS